MPVNDLLIGDGRQLFTYDDFLQFRSIGNLNKYSKKETILLPESPYRFVYMISKGIVKVYRLSKKGRETIIRILKPYEIFGENAVIDHIMSTESVEAMDECEILLIPRSDFLQVLSSDPDLICKFNRLILLRNIELENRLADLAFREVHVRAIRNLLRLAQKYGRDTGEGILLDLKITQYEFGSIIGATRETTSSILNQLRRERLINFNGRKIIITDQGKMLDILKREKEMSKEDKKTE